jgi:hypothetical protein
VFSAISNTTSQDSAHNVAAAYVVGDHAVRDGDFTCSYVVGNDAVRSIQTIGILGAKSALVRTSSCDLLDLLEEWVEDVGVIIGRLVLQD